ncbi:MAG: PIG-L family deacetylase [Phycisphaerales bacterium]|nr:PIG-L family deacetylase [Phycisphaerales bacterium]
MADRLNILVVGPHPDDQEAGMGATIARLAADGHNILLLDMTNGEPTPLGDVATRAKEAQAALEVLDQGTGNVQRRMLQLPGEARGYRDDTSAKVSDWGANALPNRWIEHTIEARRAVAGVIREHQAQVIFTPFFEDAHPDHKATTKIVEDARFDAKLTKAGLPGERIYPKWMFYYYATHLRWVANPQFCMDVTGFEDHKVRAIEAYYTQFVLPAQQPIPNAPVAVQSSQSQIPGAAGATRRPVKEWVHASLTYFGSRIGRPSGEAFYSKEPLGLAGIGGLVR